ncbi:hypothetical protein [Helicobacter sp. T3_23-1059]
MKNTFKRTFQPLEIAVKKALGIRKKRKGQIFDSNGFAINSREKITRYALSLPLFVKIRTLTNATEFSAQIGGGEIALNRYSTQ